jgi:hypothetical protein
VRARKRVHFRDAKFRVLGWGEAIVNAVEGEGGEREGRRNGRGGSYGDIEGRIVGGERSRDGKVSRR